MKTPQDIQFLPLEIQITWNDGSVAKIPFYDLRCNCPCAYCIDEFTGEKILKNEDISPDIKPISAELIGAYAMQIKWSDQHSSGIFTWDFLENFGNLGVRTDSITT